MTDAALVIAEGKVAWTGPAARAPAADTVVDAAGRAVLPGFADSHAHLVFAGERSAEFAARMAGRPYRAGGILGTVEATRAASDAALRANLRRLAAEMLRQGTTTFECKSGYGLTVPDEAGAASADHCTFLTDADVDALVSTPVVATLLPGVEFSCRQPFPQARRLLDAGAVVALATDCNPGSSFTSSMPFCIALAVREMGMTTEEAVWAATAGGARALRRTDIGHLGVGARADLILLDAPSHTYLAYRPGVPQIAAVWQAGRL